MKDLIDSIYKEITGKDVSETSQLEFHPHPSGTGHTFRYLPTKDVCYGYFDTIEDFLNMFGAKKKKTSKKVVKKVAKKTVKKAVKKAPKKVAKKK